MRFFTVVGMLLLLAGAAVLGVWRGWVPLPAEWNPWAPLDVRAAPNLLTRFKLGRLQDDPALCDQVLGEELLHQRREAWRRALSVESRFTHG